MALRAVQTVWCGSGGLRMVERELERVTFLGVHLPLAMKRERNVAFV